MWTKFKKKVKRKIFKKKITSNIFELVINLFLILIKLKCQFEIFLKCKNIGTNNIQQFEF